MNIGLVGFDGDDTLWHSEGYYQNAAAEFERIVGAWIDIRDANVRERLHAVERRNLKLFGYGAKGMTLSMVETAIELTDGRIGAQDIHRIVALGRSVLEHPVELLPGIRAAVEAAAVAAGLTNAEGQPQLSKAQGPIRVATTGRSVGPPLFESLEVLGRERTLDRLRDARARA